MIRPVVTAALLLAATTVHGRPARIEFVPHGEVSAAAMERLRSEAMGACARVEVWLGIDPSELSLRCDVYPTLEAKGLATTYTLPTHSFPARGEIACSAEEGFEGDLAREVASVVINRLLGHPGLDVLEEGLAIACAQRWRGAGCLYWASRLAALEDVSHVDWLLDNRRFHAESPLVRRAIAGAFTTFLVERMGAGPFVARYLTWEPDAGERAALERDWRTYLTTLRRGFASPGGSRPPLPGFQRGFCHAHEGYAIRDGYLSAESDRALARLRDLGVNAVSLTPFSFLRSANRPAPLRFSSSAGAENDESIIHAALCARRLGMTVMIKPHIWLGGGWPGEIAMESEKDWAAFFDDYYRWMRHYALLAEMYHVDLLCIGVELSKTTVGHEANWVSLIQRLRTVYTGPMTYAANWGGEFENVGFWRRLDFIGIDCYYPLYDGDEATDAALTAGARSVLDRMEGVARRNDRRVIVTEVGFTSGPAPWRAPHEEQRGSGSVDPEAQARCYEAFLSALPGRRRIAGVYWWKWPSDMDERGAARADFEPNGKPAEAVVRKWYRGALSR